jgi:hypothetical protein
MIFCIPGRVDVEPPSVADSLHECTTASPRVWQVAVDVIVDDVEDKVVKVFFLGYASGVVKIIFHRR